MAQTTKPKTATNKPTTKQSKVIALLSRDQGASLDEMSRLANWLPHSTRAFLTGIKKKGHSIDSDKADGLRRYRIFTAVEK
jgi:hypothetical protein